MTPAPVTTFDKTRQVALRIPGPKDRTIEVQYPTDSQWEAWRRRLKGVDGGIQENPLATKEVIAHMAGGEPQNLEDEEGAWVMRTLNSFLATVAIQGSQATMDCNVFGGRATSFVCRVPTMKQLNKFVFSATLTSQVGGESISTVNLDLLLEMTEEIVISWSNYKGDPPLTHKLSAMERMIDEVAVQSGDSDRGFFVATPQEQASQTSQSTSSEVAGSKAMKDDTSDAKKSSEAPAKTEDPVAV